MLSAPMPAIKTILVYTVGFLSRIHLLLFGDRILLTGAELLAQYPAMPIHMKLSAIFTFAFALAALAQAQTDFKSIKIDHGPYVQSLGPDSATIVWTTDSPAVSWVEIAPDDGSSFEEVDRPKFYEAPTGKKNCGSIHRIKVCGLKPATVYHYRVFSKKVLKESAEETYYGYTAATRVFNCTPPKFKTLDCGKESVTFSVVNDVHEKADRLKSMLGHVPKNIDFLLLNGDMVNNMRSRAEFFRSFLDVVADFSKGGTAVFSARGNHETRGVHSLAYLDYFPTSTGCTYYSFRMGPAYFVVMDSGEDKPDSDVEYYDRADFDAFRARQAAWLDGVVDSAEFKKAPVKILISHIPPSWERSHASKNLQKNFAPIINKAGFSLILSAHLHAHTYFPKNDVIEVPNLANSNTEMMNITADKDKIVVSFVDMDGKKTRADMVFDVKK